MALQAKSFHHLHSPLTLPHLPSSPSLAPLLSLKPLPLTFTLKRRILPLVVRVVEENQRSSEPEPEQEPEPKSELGESDLASELKKAMQERKEKEGDNFLNGVVQEISEIEWPEFGKVLGTTGVVLSVIFGSSVVLLTVNAILAELSDKVFAGKGIQDFFA